MPRLASWNYVTVWLPLQVGTTRVPSDQSRVAAFFPPFSSALFPYFIHCAILNSFASPLSHIIFAMGYGTTPDDVINYDELIPSPPSSGYVTKSLCAVSLSFVRPRLSHDSRKLARAVLSYDGDCLPVKQD